MMISPIEAHEKINKRLQEVGFPPAEEIVGRKFIFAFEDEASWPNAIVGVITGIAHSNIEGGEDEALDLLVSVPEVFCRRLQTISWTEKGWMVLLDLNEAQWARGDRPEFYGDLQLL